MDKTSISPEESAKGQESAVFNTDRAGQYADDARTTKIVYEPITRSIIGAFYAVYDKLGFGFLENVYRAALTIELRRRGHAVARELSVPVLYDGLPLARYKMDFVVDDLIVLEVKSTVALSGHERRQLMNYMCATTYEVGLLLHFGPKAKFYRLFASSDFRRR